MSTPIRFKQLSILKYFDFAQARACGRSFVDRVAAERGWVQGARRKAHALQGRGTQQTVPFSGNPQGRQLTARHSSLHSLCK